LPHNPDFQFEGAKLGKAPAISDTKVQKLRGSFLTF
jgi:hypothetical protein